MRLTRLIFAAVLALCVAGLVPLGDLRAQSNPTTLTLTIPDAYSDIYSAKFLGEFEASHPGVSIQVHKENPGMSQPAYGLDEHFKAVQKYVSSGDVLFVTGGMIAPEDTQAGYYLDLAPLVNDDQTLNPDDFYPAVWQSYQWDKGIWALPFSADPYVLLYNPDAFDKAGLTPPSDQWTVDDLIDAARKLTSQDKDGKMLPGIEVIAGQGEVFRAITKNSIIDTNVVPNVPKFATPEIADLMEKWLKLDNEGAIGVGLLKSPMSLAPAIWLALKDALAPGEQRLATMLPGGQAAINVNAFAVSGGTQYPELAYALASWLTTRSESSLSNLASTPARKSLKGAPGSSEQAFKLDVSPEVQAVIDQSIANAIPLSEMRYVDYLTLAYNRMKRDKSDAMSSLQQAENDAVKAQQQAIEQKDKLKASLVVATPVPSNVVPAGKVSLKFGLAGVNPDLTPWNKLIADFTASDSNVAAVTINVSRVSLEKLAAADDCFYLPYNGLTPEKLPKILALDPFMAADSSFDKADMLNGVLNQVTRDNRIYALPSDITPSVLKYDAATFEKAGVPAPGLTWTTNDFTDALKQLKAFNGDKPGFVPINTLGDYLLNLIVAYGGLPIDFRTTPSTISFTDPATVDAIRQITDLAQNGYFKYHTLFGSQLDIDFTPQATFIKPTALGAYALGSMLDLSPNPSLKLTLYPRGSKYSAVTYNVGTLYISANTANPEACYRWISAVAKNPSLFGSMPARRSAIDDPALVTAQGADAAAVYKQIADLLKDPNTIPLPAYSEGASVTDTMIQLELYKALDKYMAENSKVSLEEALKAAEDSAKVFQSCSDTVPALDMTSVESQKAYFNALKACALKADPDLAPFFAGVKTD